MSILIFDFHGTFTKDLDTSPKALTITDEDILEDIQEPKLMREAIIKAIEAGHKIAFASFSDITHAKENKPLAGKALIQRYLKALFPDRKDIIDQIYIVSEEPQETIDENGEKRTYWDKIDHQVKIIKHFKDLQPETKLSYSDTILIDNDYNNYFTHVTFGFLAIRADFEDAFQDNYHGHSMKKILDTIIELSSSSTLAQQLFERFCYFQNSGKDLPDLGMFQVKLSDSICEKIKEAQLDADDIRRIFPLLLKFTGYSRENIINTLLLQDEEKLNNVAADWAKEANLALPDKKALLQKEKTEISPFLKFASFFESMQSEIMNADEESIIVADKMEEDTKPTTIDYK